MDNQKWYVIYICADGVGIYLLSLTKEEVNGIKKLMTLQNDYTNEDILFEDFSGRITFISEEFDNKNEATQFANTHDYYGDEKLKY